MSRSNLLVVFTGSIAAYKACEVVSQLVQRDHTVRCVATEAALRFIGPATLEGLTGSPVPAGVFESGHALEHINLTRWADLVVVCPATANTINRLAAGLADDLPGALFLAHDRTKPWLVAPAMNPVMWAHPATQAAVAKLASWGVQFLPVGEGRTACGETGEGRLAEPAVIVSAIEAALARPAKKLRVLVTAGGPGREETFVTFAELDAALRRLLGAGRFDAVIHAAAVSDYGVDSIIRADGVVPAGGSGKIESGCTPLLRLRLHPKLVDGLRGLSPHPLAVVAFKLTHGADAGQAQAAVARLFEHSGADYVVHNDLTAGATPEARPATIHRPDGTVAAHCINRRALAGALVQLLEETISNPTVP